ncbi:MAG: HAD-IIIA family hydrolase [Acidobacteria bacterium]|nr:HAD-IIIA family hydrolase [Acidobacteriota bacterium]
MSAPSTAFIDRDGVLNRKPPEGEYVLGPEGLEILPGATGAVARLSRAGVRTVIVTNQQGVGKGLMTLEDLELIHGRLRSAVEAEGGRIDQLLVCPHLEGTCECRKPRIGLFVEARRRDGTIDFSDSVVIGDSASDMAAASAIGAQAIRVTGGTGPEDGTAVPGIAEAAELILGRES